MRTPRIAFLILLLAGAAVAQQQGSTSYTPDRQMTDAPAFMNAEVVRVDRASNKVTFRSESRETTLTVEGEALTTIGTLHAGDKVVVGYRAVKDADGRETRFVTSVVPASPTSGEPRRVTMAAGSTVRARVLSHDRSRRRVTVIDESGTLRTLGLARGVTGLDSLLPGANVAFNLGSAGTGVNIAGITSLGTTPVFANNVFPAVNGQFVSFNQRTGLVTLDTPTAGRVAFPLGNNVTSNFGALRPGDNLSLNFDVTTAALQAQSGTVAGRTTGTNQAVGTTVPLATITGVQSLTGAAPVQIAGVQGAVSPISPNTASINAQGLAGQPGATTGVQQVAQQGITRAGDIGQPGIVPPGVNQPGGVPQPQQGGVPQGNPQGVPQQAGGRQGAVQGTGAGQLVGGAAAVSPSSPLLNPVPNVSSGAPVSGAVLPPAIAKQPLSADEVGMMRAQGEADLDNAAMALAASANAIDPLWAGFKSQCLRGFTAETTAAGREWYLLAQGRILTPTDDSCRSLYADLTNRTQGFIAQLDTVEDAARKADVLPVRVREVFDRHRLR